MKKGKITFSPDLVTNPPMRVVRHSPSGDSKTIVGVKHGEPFFVYNSYARRYEIIVEFRNEPDDAVYRLVADRLDWEKLIAKVQHTIKSTPDD